MSGWTTLTVLGAIALAGSAAPAWAAGQETLGAISRPHRYAIEASLDPVTHDVTGVEDVTYFNRSRTPLDEVVFQLYPNNFRPGSRYLTELGARYNLDVFYPNGRDPGGITVSAVSSAGRALAYTERETALHVRLDAPLAPGRSVKLRLAFKTHVPEAYDRFGRQGDSYCLGYWYPRLAVLGPGGWDAPYRDALFREFHDEYATFNVTMSLPSRFVVGATGRRTGREAARGDRTVYRYEAEDVRSFCLVADPDFVEHEGLADGVRVHVLALPGEEYIAPRIVSQTEDMVRYYNGLVGRYPYKDLTIVSSMALPIGGIEMPQVVLNSRAMARLEDLPRGYLEPGYKGLNAHEVAHQWFFGVVGNDEAAEPWLDESFTSYLTLRFLEREGGEDDGYATRFGRGLSFLNRWHLVLRARESQYQEALRQELAGLVIPVSTPLTAVPLGQVNPTYYSRGPIVIEMLRAVMGEATFDRFLKRLYATRRFRNTTTADVEAVASEVAEQPMRSFFDTWVRGEGGTLDYQAHDFVTTPLAGGGFRSTVRVRQAGTTDLAVPVGFALPDGRYALTRYTPGAPEVTLDTAERPTGVMVDPGLYTLDGDFTNNGQFPLHVFPFVGEPYPHKRALLLGAYPAFVGTRILGGTVSMDLTTIRDAQRGLRFGVVDGRPVWNLSLSQPIYGVKNYDSRLTGALAQRPFGLEGSLGMLFAVQPAVGENPTWLMSLGGNRRVVATTVDPAGPTAGVTALNVDLGANYTRAFYGLRPAGTRYRVGLEAVPAALGNPLSYLTPSLEASHHVDLGWYTTLSLRGVAAMTAGLRADYDPLLLDREGLFRTVGLGTAGDTLGAVNLEYTRPLGGAFYLPLLPPALLATGLGFASSGWAGRWAYEAGVGARLGVAGLGNASIGLDWTPLNNRDGFAPGTLQLKGGYAY